MSQISRLVSIAVVSLFVLTAQGMAETYPDRVVRIVNPYPPGGSVDVMARILAQKLSNKLTFDPAKDFAPIALFATAPIVLIVHPAVAANDVQELIALAKKDPGKINFASAGNGTTNHLSGELFKSKAGIDIVHVPYRGAGPAMNDLIGGHVQMFFDLMPVVLPQTAPGKGARSPMPGPSGRRHCPMYRRSPSRA